MSRLFEFAKSAARRFLQGRSTLKVSSTPAPSPPGNMKSRPGPPPIHRPPTGPPQPSPQELRDIQQVEEVYSEIQLLGRDRGHSDDMQAVMDQMRRVSSSNVYGYFFELESATSGILYVTFLGDRGKGARTNSPGSTYAYYDVPAIKIQQFQAASESSAGGAVWDYLRVRQSHWEHQHRYRLIQVAGDYVPRKASQTGFQSRTLAPVGQPKIANSVWAALSRLEHSKDPQVREYGARMKRELLASQSFRRSTLAPRTTTKGRQILASRSALPSRGTPNRGAPNRG
jgi:hypothetical protein